MSLLERLVPSRLGEPFRWLLGGFWVAQLGDGIVLAAGPLLVASQTDSAVLVGLAAALQRVPWLVFGLHAGAIADRLDRKRVTIAMDAVRVLVLLVLCGFIVTGWVNVGVVLAAMFLIGVAEVFADSASATLLPMLVQKTDLGIANARTMSGHLLLNQLAGAPVGAFLFGVGMAVPFGAQALCMALAVVLISRVATPPSPRGAVDTHVGRDIREGLVWLWQHEAVRTLALTILLFNVTWGAAWGVLVLYSTELLGMSAVGFGLMTTMTAIGGLISTLSYGWIERRFSLSLMMKTCLLLEVVMHLVLALNRSQAVALLVMFFFGAYAFVWGTLSNAVRQRVTPAEFQGRIGAVYRVGLFGGLVVGQILGGVIADVWGLAGPYWFAFVGSALVLAVVWPQLKLIVHADEEAVAER
ncbi:MAG: MFS transporter [Nocardioides sp.]